MGVGEEWEKQKKKVKEALEETTGPAQGLREGGVIAMVTPPGGGRVRGRGRGLVG